VADNIMFFTHANTLLSVKKPEYSQSIADSIFWNINENAKKKEKKCYI